MKNQFMEKNVGDLSVHLLHYNVFVAYYLPWTLRVMLLLIVPALLLASHVYVPEDDAWISSNVNLNGQMKRIH